MNAMNERGGVTEEDARNRVRCGQMIPCYIKLRSQKENKKTENRHFDYLSAWLQSIQVRRCLINRWFDVPTGFTCCYSAPSLFPTNTKHMTNTACYCPLKVNAAF